MAASPRNSRGILVLILDRTRILSGRRAKRVGAIQVGNIVLVGRFAASWLIRESAGDGPGVLGLAPSFGVGGHALVAGWLRELVSLGVGDGTHIDAPRAFSGPVGASVGG